MTITINLLPEEEARLRKRAARTGQDLESFVSGVIQRDAFQESYINAGESQSLAEAMKGLIGMLDSSKKNNGVSHVAENAGEEYTNILVEQRKAGHL